MKKMFHIDTIIVCFILTHYNKAGVLQMLYIKQIRERIGKTQQEVADYLKMQRPSYANIENNKRDPDTATILALSEYFHCSIDEMFGRDPSRLPKMTESERRAARLFSDLSEEGQEKALEYLEFITEKGYIKTAKNDILHTETGA